MNLESIEKGGYDYFMMKEIYEQPRSIFDSFRGRFDSNTGQIHMRSMEDYAERLKEIKRLILIGCGTSWHAGLVAEYIFEEFEGELGKIITLGTILNIGMFFWLLKNKKETVAKGIILAIIVLTIVTLFL